MRAHYKKAGFTLVELLAVIAIISFLLLLVIPGLQYAFEKANQTKCKSNLRNIGTAMISFADDHNGRLPGCDEAVGEADWQKEFIGKEVLDPEIGAMDSIPSDRVGTILEYLPVQEDSARTIYRCPSKKTERLGSKQGSNGCFDYSMVKSLAGGQLSRIPPRAVLYKDTPEETQVVTPLIVEESAEYSLNTKDADPSHAGTDRLSTHHSGDKAFYFGIDGSVGEVESPGGEGPAATDWRVDTSFGWYGLGDPGVVFGKLQWDPD